MKNFLFAAVMLFGTGMFANNEIKNVPVKETEQKEVDGTACCRRTAYGRNGNFVTVNYCVSYTGNSSREAMGIACAKAMDLAQQAVRFLDQTSAPE